MISKFISLNSKVSKYVSKKSLRFLNPLLDTTYWNYYLNMIPENRVKFLLGLESEDLNAVDNYVVLSAIKSYKEQYTDSPVDAGALTNLVNITNPSTVKTVKCPASATGSHSGIRFTFTSSSLDTQLRYVNACVFQLNKLDKAKMDIYKEGTFVFEYIRKPFDTNNQTANNSTGVRIEWSNSNNVSSVSSVSDSATVSSNTSNFEGTRIRQVLNFAEDGCFLVDKELLKHANLEYLKLSGDNGSQRITHINFYFIHPTLDNVELEIANITLTNSYDVYLDDQIKFNRRNLTVFNKSKKSGVVFPDVNEEDRALDAKVSLLTLDELGKLDNHVVKNAKDCPIFFFPYCEGTSELSNANALNDEDGARIKKLNYSGGGLWTFDPSYDINNYTSEYYFDVSIKLDEYK